MMEGVRFIDANNLDQLEAVVTDKTAGIVIEGIQGEGGIHLMSAAFLRKARELADRHPGDEFSLVIGADSLHDLPTWYEPRELVKLAELIVVPRPGVALVSAGALAASLGVGPGDVRLRVVACPLMEIASRDVRRRVSEGKSIRYLVPRAVEEFIREKGLYAARAD